MTVFKITIYPNHTIRRLKRFKCVITGPFDKLESFRLNVLRPTKGVTYCSRMAAGKGWVFEEDKLPIIKRALQAYNLPYEIDETIIE